MSTRAGEAAGDRHAAAGATRHRRMERLRRRLERRRAVRMFDITLAGAAAPLRIWAPADPDAVLDEVAEAAWHAGVAHDGGDPGSAPAEGLRMPYWATPWASGLALAEMALERRHELAGRRVLELGCGLGTTAAAALLADADLTVVDCFSETLAYCVLNALHNAHRIPRTMLADWRTTAGQQRLMKLGPFAVVLAADVLYEPEDVAPLLALAPALVMAGGMIWLAEPGRTTSQQFVAEARRRGWIAEQRVVERIWPAGAGYARVGLHTLRFGEASRSAMAACGAGCAPVPRGR